MQFVLVTLMTVAVSLWLALLVGMVVWGEAWGCDDVCDGTELTGTAAVVSWLSGALAGLWLSSAVGIAAIGRCVGRRPRCWRWGLAAAVCSGGWLVIAASDDPLPGTFEVLLFVLPLAVVGLLVTAVATAPPFRARSRTEIQRSWLSFVAGSAAVLAVLHIADVVGHEIARHDKPAEDLYKWWGVRPAYESWEFWVPLAVTGIVAGMAILSRRDPGVKRVALAVCGLLAALWVNPLVWDG